MPGPAACQTQPMPGRLYEKCLELLQGADIQFTRSNRLDVALVRNHPIALVFLPAADIPRFVGEGNIDLGITGPFAGLLHSFLYDSSVDRPGHGR
jgi:hypothetical protein